MANHLKRRIAKLEEQAPDESGPAILVPHEGETARQFWDRIGEVAASGRPYIIVPAKGQRYGSLEELIDDIALHNKPLIPDEHS